MTRGDIISRFRQENPSVTKNVATSAVLQSWTEIGNLEIATKARLIRGETTFPSIIDKTEYNLTTEIPKFYDIDELPGSGVIYDNRQIDSKSISLLDQQRPSWRTQANGVPRDYYRRNQFLNLGRKPSAVKDILVYTVLIADPLDDDSKTPFNQFAHLEPFHYALVLYLEKRVYGNKVIRKFSEMTATEEYNAYVSWITKETQRGIYDNIQIRPPTTYKAAGRYRTRR